MEDTKLYYQISKEVWKGKELHTFSRKELPIFRHIKSNNSGMAKVKIVKNERDPPLFTSKQQIKFLKDSKKHNSSYRTT
jgi:hypothetical protein